MGNKVFAVLYARILLKMISCLCKSLTAMGNAPPVVHSDPSPLAGIGVHLQGVTHVRLHDLAPTKVIQAVLLEDLVVNGGIAVFEGSIHYLCEKGAKDLPF